MASKRMFDKSFLESDNFLELPHSAQLLYVHLSLNADDDGFLCNYKGIMRLIGCTKSDFDALLENGYVIKFESGVIVISHWKINNNIRKDRYKPTNCQEINQVVLSNDVYYTPKSNEAHLLNSTPNSNQVSTECHPNDTPV